MLKPSMPILFGATFLLSCFSYGDPFVPGTGHLVPNTNDDFEDPNWKYNHNHPKSSQEQDKQLRAPTGSSANGRVFEAAKRGQPDDIQRVTTPAGGLPGSKGALMMQTLQAGVPGQPTNDMKQDDLLMKGPDEAIPLSKYPSTVVHVYIPDFASFKGRQEIFGVRTGINITPIPKPSEEPEQPRRRGFRAQNKPKEYETMYYPGYFIRYLPETNTAQFEIRANEQGRDVKSYVIHKGKCWWTLGMSFTPDSKVHYYMKPGVEPLEKKDHVASYSPYFGTGSLSLDKIFFDLTIVNDHKAWSAQWIVDDPKLYQYP